MAEGRLRAALDPDPLPPEHPGQLPGAIITPHVAGGPASFYPRAKRPVEQQPARFARSEPLVSVVR